MRGLEISEANQVWQIDISNVPMAGGFVYLVAITDVYIRFIVGWNISNSMQAGWVVETLKGAIARYGFPPPDHQQ
jgi:putative transposase